MIVIICENCVASQLGIAGLIALGLFTLFIIFCFVRQFRRQKDEPKN